MKNPSRIGVLLLLLAGCQNPTDSKTNSQAATEPQQSVAVQCKEPRPEVCTFQYDPVCGLRDYGSRCVTTPCPSAEWQEYGNACSACSDPRVIGYRPGQCTGEDSPAR